MNSINMKKILILGGGGFIGGHLSKRLKEEGNFVRVVDIKKHDFFRDEEFCSQFVKSDLREMNNVESVFRLEMIEGNILPYTYYPKPFVDTIPFDEVYQLAADMGGAGYIFTGEHDSEVMHNSVSINLNVVKECVRTKVGKVFYSSSACMYPEHNQLDPLNPNCEESSAYPANPDSEYGWEKLFSERLYFAFSRNHNLDVRVARFHNIFGPYGTWRGGKEKSPAAMCRKVSELNSGDKLEVWGDGLQTRSFLYIDECVEGVLRFMRQDNFQGPVNIGSEEMVTINDLAQIAINISGKDIEIKNIFGKEFQEKYGHKCPLGVKGRNSDNNLYREKMGWEPKMLLSEGMSRTFEWINEQVKKNI